MNLGVLMNLEIRTQIMNWSFLLSMFIVFLAMLFLIRVIYNKFKRFYKLAQGTNDIEQTACSTCPFQEKCCIDDKPKH